MAKLWFRIFLKLLTFTSLVMAVLVTGISSITVVAVVKAGTSSPMPPIPASDGNLEFDSDISMTADEKEKYWKEIAKILPKFPEIKGEYKKVVLGSLIAAIAAGILQMLSSLVVLLSCSKELQKKMKYGIMVNLILFLIMLICFTAPLIYNPTEGSRLQIHELKEKVVMDFYKLQEKSFTENLMHELNAFLVIVGLNEALLLGSVIILSISYCMKCGDYNYTPIS